MAYTVDYKSPSKTKANAKKKRITEIKKLVKWNLDTLEHATVSTGTIERSHLISLLKLKEVTSSKTDKDGNHALQQIIAMGIVNRPTSSNGRQYFDRDDTIKSLRAWAC